MDAGADADGPRQRGDRVRGLDAGADDYLVKPFSLLELAARLRALSRRDDRSRPVVLAAGDLKLDPAAKRAWRDGTELHLSPKEFALLELFLRHPGHVLTRSQVIADVWDFAYDGGSNVVDQYRCSGHWRGSAGWSPTPATSSARLSRCCAEN